MVAWGERLVGNAVHGPRTPFTFQLSKTMKSGLGVEGAMLVTKKFSLKSLNC